MRTSFILCLIKHDCMYIICNLVKLKLKIVVDLNQFSIYVYSCKQIFIQTSYRHKSAFRYCHVLTVIERSLCSFKILSTPWQYVCLSRGIVHALKSYITIRDQCDQGYTLPAPIRFVMPDGRGLHAWLWGSAKNHVQTSTNIVNHGIK